MRVFHAYQPTAIANILCSCVVAMGDRCGNQAAFACSLRRNYMAAMIKLQSNFHQVFTRGVAKIHGKRFRALSIQPRVLRKNPDISASKFIVDGSTIRRRSVKTQRNATIGLLRGAVAADRLTKNSSDLGKREPRRRRSVDGRVTRSLPERSCVRAPVDAAIASTEHKRGCCVYRY
jgi:hypothetical protein